MKVLVTGSCGLIGSEAVAYYSQKDCEVWGIDNHLRKYFFGKKGDTASVGEYFKTQYTNYRHCNLDIRDREGVSKVIKTFRPDFIVHAAAQPSHDWAAKEPFTDFDVNAGGTLSLLEAYRKWIPNSVFAFLSTNKVYGDGPNHVDLVELPTRYEFRGKLRERGVSESFQVDQCLHSLFGVSKLSADLMCQEYARYFELNIGVFRGGCLTGSQHASVPLHGFLNYIVECAVKGNPYTLIGYKGKQVRDQIHASDVIQALDHFRKAPRLGEVYNIGGGYENSASIVEIIERLKKDHDLQMPLKYADDPRKGDHICYYTDLTKLKEHYPQFEIRVSLSQILKEMVRVSTEKHGKHKNDGSFRQPDIGDEISL